MRRSIRNIKMWPITTNFVIFVAFLFALFDTKIYDITSPLFGVCLYASYCWYGFSVDFKFCKWHRVLIANLALVSVVVLLNNIAIRFDSGIEKLTLIRLILSSTTLFSFIATILYFKHGLFKITIK